MMETCPSVMSRAFSSLPLDLYTPSSMTMPMGTPVDREKKSVLMAPTTWRPASRARETAVLMVTAPYTEPEPWTRMGVTELSSSSSREKLSTRLSLLTVMVL